MNCPRTSHTEAGTPIFYIFFATRHPPAFCSPRCYPPGWGAWHTLTQAKKPARAGTRAHKQQAEAAAAPKTKLGKLEGMLRRTHAYDGKAAAR